MIPDVGKRHRVCWASADLTGEDGSDEPWNAGTVWGDATATAMESTTIGSGPADVACMFDGGSKHVRREIEEIVDKAPMNHDHEITIVYAVEKKTRGRSHMFARPNR